jgi:hypothetical protein
LKNDRTSETLCPSLGFWLHLPRFVERSECSKANYVATWCNYRFPSSRENAVIIASCGSSPKLNPSPSPRSSRRGAQRPVICIGEFEWGLSNLYFFRLVVRCGHWWPGVDDMNQAIRRARSCVPRSVACTIYHEVQFWPKTGHKFPEIYSSHTFHGLQSCSEAFGEFICLDRCGKWFFMDCGGQTGFLHIVPAVLRPWD